MQVTNVLICRNGFSAASQVWELGVNTGCFRLAGDAESGRVLVRLRASFRGCATLTADVPEERLHAGVLERLAEDERLCNWVVVRQPPGSQSDDVTRRFLSVGGCEEFGIL